MKQSMEFEDSFVILVIFLHIIQICSFPKPPRFSASQLAFRFCLVAMNTFYTLRLIEVDTASV